jgi:Flp pilus assembly CpaE family ATPase
MAGALLSRLTALADFVIVDLPPASDAATESIIKSSDQIIVVLEPEITCVAAAVQRVAQINGYSNTLETRLVGVNRQGAMQLSVREIESRLNRTLANMIPPATDVIGVAAQYGTPARHHAADSHLHRAHSRDCRVGAAREDIYPVSRCHRI